MEKYNAFEHEGLALMFEQETLAERNFQTMVDTHQYARLINHFNEMEIESENQSVETTEVLNTQVERKGSNLVNKSLLLGFFMLMFSLNTTSQIPLTVPYVNLERYAGKWFEIASFPQRFQKGCNCSTAEYTLTDKKYITVENRCNRDSVNGKQSYIKGKAFVVKNSGNAKLKVQFFWPFRAKYWIIDLADDYSYAVVSHPNKKYLWILSRTPVMSDSIYQQIVFRIKEKGIDVSKLKLTKQINQ
ncbi:MAG TPA: lipocalin family protein [Bacteroidia bacterium]